MKCTFNYSEHEIKLGSLSFFYVLHNFWNENKKNSGFNNGQANGDFGLHWKMSFYVCM